MTQMEVTYIDGESYEIAIRSHRVVVAQPTETGGGDVAPTPTELFVASVASCVAFYAGRYLTRHGYRRTGLSVSARFEFAPDRPSRVGEITMEVKVPSDLPESRWPALEAVAGHCTVHNTMNNPPRVRIELT